MSRPSEALEALERFPRTPLAHLPTPLLPAPRLREALGPDAPPILVKHDELTGFALGGNKVRKLELELAPGLLEGVTHIVTTGGPQSNHCRVTAAAAARLGRGCVLVIGGEPGEPPRGNALLHRLFGAEIRVVAGREEREPAMAKARVDVAAAGGRALVVPLGASTPTGALGYALAAVEIDRQIADLDGAAGDDVPPPTAIYLASSSGGTLGGLAAGFTLLGRDGVRLVGVSADVSRGELVETALALARGALELLGSNAEVPEGLVDATDREVGGGYAVPTLEGGEATRLLARTEGILLDPVYTAKAAAGLLRAVAEDAFRPGERALFLHTGGHPALFV